METTISHPPPNHCSNCAVGFSESVGAVSEIHIFSASNEFERSITLLEALGSIFTSKPLLLAQELDLKVIMCPKCAEVVSNLYKDYLNLLQLSNSVGYVCSLISQMETWHNFHKDQAEAEDENVSMDQQNYDDYDDDYVPEVVTVDDDENDENFIVTDLLQLGPGLGGSKSPARSSPRKSPAKKKGATAALKKRYKLKVAAQKKQKKKAAKAKAGTGHDQKEKIVKLASAELKMRKSSRYQCRFINKRQYVTCKDCPNTFLYNWKLHEHYLETHEAKARDECEAKCGFTYYPEIIIPSSHVCLTDAHLHPKSSRKNRKRPVLCEICGDRFMAERMLLFHQEQKHVQPEIKFKCIKCGKQVKTRTKLVMHLETHNPEKTYLCTECGVAFAQRRGLDKHRLTHADPTIPCEVCGKLFKAKDSLRIHLQTIHSLKEVVEEEEGEESQKIMTKKLKLVESGPQVCEVCTKEFRTSRNLKEHVKYMHSGDMYRKFVCGVCNKKEYTITKLKRHMKEHLLEKMKTPIKTQGKPYFCGACGKQFVYKTYLIGHEKACRQVSKYKCSVCNKPLGNNFNAMKQHERTHMKDEELANCPEHLRSKRSSNKPKPGESDTREFTCDECGLSYTYKRSLVEHKKLTHSYTETFSCPLCEKKFGASRHLTRHMKTHSRFLLPGQNFITELPPKKSIQIEGTLSEAIDSRSQGQSPSSVVSVQEGDQNEIGMLMDKSAPASIEAPSLALAHSSPNRAKPEPGELLAIEPAPKLAADAHPFQCDVCLKIYSSKRSLIEHKAIHTGEHLKVECDRCKGRFRTSTKLRLHQIRCGIPKVKVTGRRKELGPLSSNLRAPRTISKDSFINQGEVQVEGPANQFPCDWCRKIYKNKKTLAEHQLMHSGAHLRFECDRCHHRLRSRTKLNIHKMNCTARNPGTSESEADANAVKTVDLESPNNPPVPPEELLPFQCDVCRKIYKNTKSLREHQLMHTGEHLKFECEICRHRLRSITKLQLHMKTCLAKNRTALADGQEPSTSKSAKNTPGSPSRAKPSRQIRRPARYKSESDSEPDQLSTVVTEVIRRPASILKPRTALPTKAPVSSRKVLSAKKSAGSVRAPSAEAKEPAAATKEPQLRIQLARDNDIEKAIAAGELSLRKSTRRQLTPEESEPEPEPSDSEPDSDKEFILP